MHGRLLCNITWTVYFYCLPDNCYLDNCQCSVVPSESLTLSKWLQLNTIFRYNKWISLRFLCRGVETAQLKVWGIVKSTVNSVINWVGYTKNMLRLHYRKCNKVPIKCIQTGNCDTFICDILLWRKKQVTNLWRHRRLKDVDNMNYLFSAQFSFILQQFWSGQQF